MLILHFKCECSDEACSQRIEIKLGTYQEIHTNRDTFIIKLEHQVDSIEKVIKTTSEYSVGPKTAEIFMSETEELFARRND